MDVSIIGSFWTSPICKMPFAMTSSANGQLERQFHYVSLDSTVVYPSQQGKACT